MAALMHDAMEDCGITKAELIERFGAPTADLVDGLTKLDKLQLLDPRGVAGRVVPQDAAGDDARRARDPGQARRPAAQHAHDGRGRPRQADAHRRRDARHLRADRAPARPEPDLPRAAGALVQAPQAVARGGAVEGGAEGARLPARHRRADPARRREGVRQRQAAGADLRPREDDLLDLRQDAREAPELRAGERHLRLSHRRRHAARVLRRDGRAAPALQAGAGRFKDYIAIPKANGYQSLHTTLVSPLGTAVEFQIRTEPMHAVAEKGIAAHWLYKEHDDGPGQEAQRLGAMWLQSLLDIQDETRDANEFLEHVKIDLFPDAVYVFTPKSKILALPRGATPVDFAYAIHSDVGDHCVAAKVNGEPVPLRTELRSGDVVEIIGAPNARPNPAWLNFVAHRPGALEDPPLPEEHGAGGVARPRREDAGAGDARRGPRPARRRLRPRPRVWQQLIRWSGNKHPRRPVHRHRPRPQDRHHRRHAAGAPAGRRRHPPRRADADDGPLRRRRLGAGAEHGADRRQRRRLGAARHLLPADPRRRDRRQPRPRRRPDGAHRRMQRRQAPARARQRALDAGRVGRAADPLVRDRRRRCWSPTARACSRRWPRR